MHDKENVSTCLGFTSVFIIVCTFLELPPLVPSDSQALIDKSVASLPPGAGNARMEERYKYCLRSLHYCQSIEGIGRRRGLFVFHLINYYKQPTNPVINESGNYSSC